MGQGQSEANGLRLVLAARKSRNGEDGEDTKYQRQDNRAKDRAERDNHAVIKMVHDTISSQSLPWERKNLKAWMTDPQLLAQYDGILISETDRLSRLDDRGWHYIEDWCYRHDKCIVTAEGVRFPPRDDSDRYQWLGLKRRARTYWEDVRDKYGTGRDVVKANGAALGRPPFGYRSVGQKYSKRFTLDPVLGPVLIEIFRRVADGQSATSVTDWLEENHPLKPQARQAKRPWRVRTVTRLIQNRSYLGEREGHKFDMPCDDFQELWDRANAILNGRQAPRGGRRIVHGYSSAIVCPCGGKLYFKERVTRHEYGTYAYQGYICGTGRRGVAGEEPCKAKKLDFEAVNAAVDKAMREVDVPEIIPEVRGGDFGKKQKLAELEQQMDAARAARNMKLMARLAVEYDEVENQPSEPVVKFGRPTGRTIGQVWAASDLEAQRALLATGQFSVIVLSDDAVLVEVNDGDEDDEESDLVA